jgi:hypothetical protein
MPWVVRLVIVLAPASEREVGLRLFDGGCMRASRPHHVDDLAIDQLGACIRRERTGTALQGSTYQPPKLRCGKRCSIASWTEPIEADICINHWHGRLMWELGGAHHAAPQCGSVIGAIPGSTFGANQQAPYSNLSAQHPT